MFISSVLGHKHYITKEKGLIDMREIVTSVYKFEELSEEAQDTAVESLWDINVDYGWWNFIYDEATKIGCQIEGFDIDRGECALNLSVDGNSVIKLILANHGENCDTYKTALNFKDAMAFAIKAYDEDFEGDPEVAWNLERIITDFQHALTQDYMKIIREGYEYLTSREVIIETIQCNEYEFTARGKIH